MAGLANSSIAVGCCKLQTFPVCAKVVLGFAFVPDFID